LIKTRLKPKGNKKEFIFKSFDSINKDLIKWKERIDQMIENTKHLNKNQQNFVGEKRFWRVNKFSNFSSKGSRASSSKKKWIR